jgi:hypothetical protein
LRLINSDRKNAIPLEITDLEETGSPIETKVVLKVPLKD